MVLSLIITATMLLCGTYMVSADAQTSGTQQVGTEHALTAAGEAVGEALTSALATGSSAGTAATGPALSGGYGGGWICGPLDHDVTGTDISVTEETIKADCRAKCDKEPDCTFITYGYKAPYKLRCVLKKDWNNGLNGTTGVSDGITFCCDQHAEPSRCKLS